MCECANVWMCECVNRKAERSFRRAALKAKTFVSRRRKDRFQENLLFSVNKTSFFKPEDTLGIPRRRVEDRRDARSKKRPPAISKYDFT